MLQLDSGEPATVDGVSASSGLNVASEREGVEPPFKRPSLARAPLFGAVAGRAGADEALAPASCQDVEVYDKIDRAGIVVGGRGFGIAGVACQPRPAAPRPVKFPNRVNAAVNQIDQVTQQNAIRGGESAPTMRSRAQKKGRG
ncbi:MAG TPA: hypothetical protein PLF78_14560 [Caulobacter sp.]|nr:hypothetical protein [Caulobacter sp.]